MHNSDLKAKFYFGDVVIVEKDLVGCVVKTWCSHTVGFTYEVYVRYSNAIFEYAEDDLKRFIVGKELTEEESTYYD